MSASGVRAPREAPLSTPARVFWRNLCTCHAKARWWEKRYKPAIGIEARLMCAVNAQSTGQLRNICAVA
ncbi:MAG: hypothetical protein RJA70_1286 [Pseudomonadota bacterium]